MSCLKAWCVGGRFRSSLGNELVKNRQPNCCGLSESINEKCLMVYRQCTKTNESVLEMLLPV